MGNSASCRRLFIDTVEEVILDAVDEGRDGNKGIAEPKPFGFAEYKIDFVPDFEHRCEMDEMVFGGCRVPASPFDEAAHELFFPRDEVHHPAFVMADECDGAHATNSHSIRHLELAVAQVCPARSDDEGKVVGNVEVLPVIHAHPDEEAGRSEGFVRPREVMVLEKPAYRRIPEMGRDVGGSRDGNEPVHCRMYEQSGGDSTRLEIIEVFQLHHRGLVGNMKPLGQLHAATVEFGTPVAHVV
jgi:hypothetical protein